jgi:hypothetical protein
MSETLVGLLGGIAIGALAAWILGRKINET